VKRAHVTLLPLVLDTPKKIERAKAVFANFN